MSFLGKSDDEWCLREDASLVRIRWHTLLIFIGINGNLHKDLTSLAKVQTGQGDNKDKMKFIKN